MKKNLLWISIISTLIAVVNLIVYTILACLDIVEMRYLSYLFILGYLICAWIPFLLNYIFKIKFGHVVIITYQIFLILSLLVGSLWQVYKLWTPFDKIVHFGSGVMIALFAYALFKESKNNKISLFWLFMLAFSIAMMCGGVWEIWEFTTDILFHNDAQITEDLIGRMAIMDTMYDIICDFVGGLIGATIAVLLECKKRKTKEDPAENLPKIDSVQNDENA